MKKSLLITVTFLLAYSSAYCRNKDSLYRNDRHMFLLNIEGKYYLNKTNLETALGTKEWLSTKNLGGYQVGLAYEYENRKHITYTTTIGFGMQEHYLEWNYNLDEYAPRFNFTPSTYSRFERHTTQYLNTTFLLGYNYHLPKNEQIMIQGKAGVGFLDFINSIRQGNKNYISFKNSAGDTTFIRTINTNTRYLGSQTYNGNLLPDDHLDESHYFTIHIYGGASFETDKKIIKRVDIGVKYVQVLPGKDPEAGFVRSTYYNFEVERDGVQYYGNKFRSFSIMVGLGF